MNDQRDIASVLQKVFYYENLNDITVGEVAHAIGIHERQLYYLIEGERKPDAEMLRRLSLYLIEQYEDPRVADHFLPDGCTVMVAGGKLNGSVNDELLNIDEIQGQIISACRKRDYSTVARLADSIISQGAQLKREAKAKSK
jgi:hypothetical protein